MGLLDQLGLCYLSGQLDQQHLADPLGQLDLSDLLPRHRLSHQLDQLDQSVQLYPVAQLAQLDLSLHRHPLRLSDPSVQ